ncbi:hypothetical protein ACFVH7_07710 [Kitasatospora indigofera]
MMNGTYQAALNSTLVSVTTGQGSAVLLLLNSTDFPLAGYLVSDTGVWLGASEDATFGPGYPALTVAPGSQWGSTDPVDPGWYFVFLNSYSGAFAAVKQVGSTIQQGAYVMTVNAADLLNPNDIGGVPKPNQSVLIPSDGPHIVVGCGALPNKNLLAREQYWQRMPDSYSIARGEKRHESYAVTTGIEATSSDQETLAGSLSASAHAGWGPISASVSASLNASSTSFQSITTSTEQTSSVSETYDNTTGTHPETYFYWQLTNVITVFDSDGNALSSLIYGAEGPAVISGPHHFDALPPRPLVKESAMSATMRASLSRTRVLAR